jgi:hypothetical protein
MSFRNPFRRPAGPASEAARAPVDPASLRFVFSDPAEEARRRVMVFALEVPADDLGRIADLALRGLDPARDRPVMVVSTLDFAALRDRDLAFEYLPGPEGIDPADRAALEAHAAYRRRRLSLIRLKWEPAVEVVLGRPPEAFVAGPA